MELGVGFGFGFGFGIGSARVIALVLVSFDALTRWCSRQLGEERGRGRWGGLGIRVENGSCEIGCPVRRFVSENERRERQTRRRRGTEIVS